MGTRRLKTALIAFETHAARVLGAPSEHAYTPSAYVPRSLMSCFCVSLAAAPPALVRAACRHVSSAAAVFDDLTHAEDAVLAAFRTAAIRFRGVCQCLLEAQLRCTGHPAPGKL
jgi:hypothetical protein